MEHSAFSPNRLCVLCVTFAHFAVKIFEKPLTAKVAKGPSLPSALNAECYQISHCGNAAQHFGEHH